MAPTDEPASLADDQMNDVRATIERTIQQGDGPFEAVPEASVGDVFDVERLAGREPVDGYWVDEPFAYVSIRYDPDEKNEYYHVLEPTLTDFEETVYDDLEPTLRRVLLDEEYERTEEGVSAFQSRLEDLLATHASTVDPLTRWKLHYYFNRNFVGFGPLNPMMQDPAIEDVSCDGADIPIYVYHRTHGKVPSDQQYSEETLRSIASRLAQRSGRHVSASYPLATTTLPDGSRVQITLKSDIATRGTNFTIRKFSEEPFSPVDLVDLGSYSPAQMAYLWLAVEHNKSILFVGPTASGKTTSMNAVSVFVPPDDKIISIEETREVNLPHDNWVADVTREADLSGKRPEISMYDLLDEALHQRPDYLLVGELRTDHDVVYTFFQALGTGHDGFSTFHAESSADTVRRLSHSPLDVPMELIADLDLISVQHQVESLGGDVRRCRQLTEVGQPASEADRPELRDIFTYNPADDSFEQIADSRLLGDIAEDQGWDDDRLRTELEHRRAVLGYLLDEGITEFEAVTELLFEFARDPEPVLSRIGEQPPAGSSVSFTHD